MEKKCKICSKVFYKSYKESVKQWSERNFCSRKCFGKSLAVPLVQFICEQCRKEVLRKPRSDNRYRFCGTICGGKASFSEANKRDRTGSKNPAWKGGKNKDMSGYLVLNEFVNKKRKKTLEHRRIMELQLGRKLSTVEVVHHINGIRDDNRIENLYLCKNQSEHTKIHASQNPHWGQHVADRG